MSKIDDCVRERISATEIYWVALYVLALSVVSLSSVLYLVR